MQFQICVHELHPITFIAIYSFGRGDKAGIASHDEPLGIRMEPYQFRAYSSGM